MLLVQEGDVERSASSKTRRLDASQFIGGARMMGRDMVHILRFRLDCCTQLVGEVVM